VYVDLAVVTNATGHPVNQTSTQPQTQNQTVGGAHTNQSTSAPPRMVNLTEQNPRHHVRILGERALLP
jgi:hypothetical protein